MPKPRKKISAITRVLAASNTKSIVLEQFFEKLTPGEIANSVPRISKHRHFRDAVQMTLAGVGPDIYRELTPAASLEKNAAWCIGLLRVHKDAIKFFVEREAAITADLLNGRDADVLRALDEIDSRCGLSAWSVTLRGAFYASTRRDHEQQAYLDDLWAKTKGNQFLQAVLINIYRRYNQTSKMSRDTRAEEFQIRRTEERGFLNFLMYRVFQDYCDFRFEYLHVLNFEKNASVVDMFKCLFNFCVYSEFGDLSAAEKESAKYVARVLATEFDYRPIVGIASAHDSYQSWVFNEIDYQVLDAYTRGDYLSVSDLIRNAPESIRKFAIFELWAKSEARVNRYRPASIAGELLDALTKVLLRGDEYEQSVAYLLAITFAFASLPWFQQLRYLILREGGFMSRDKKSRLLRLSTVLSDLDSPLKLNVLSTERRKQFVTKCDAAVGTSVTLQLLAGRFERSGALEALEGEVHPTRLLKYRAAELMQKSDFAQAIPLLEQLLTSNDNLARFDASVQLVQGLIESDQLEQAAELFAVTCLGNANVLHLYDTEEISSICRRLLERDSASINVPVALSLHSRFANKEHFEQFLKKNGAVVPQDLFERSALFPRAQFLYFLEFVCTPSVMQLYLKFESTTEIEQCRIEVCRYLIDVGHAVATMVEEVKDRTRRLVIRDAAKKVASSRIFADTGAFRGPSGSEFLQLHDRYTSLCRRGSWMTKDEEALRNICAVLSEMPSALHSVHILETLNEKNATLLDLIKRMRNEFALGERGLNSYLSTRIRHGHLPTTLRRGPVAHSLLNPKSESTKGYKDNSYWMSKFVGLPETKVAAVDRILREFSREYDKLVDTINEEWLQITILDLDMASLGGEKARRTALFNYSVTAAEAYYLGGLTNAESEYPDFSRIVTRWLWDRTDRNLAAVRKKIDTEVREKTGSLLDGLQRDVIAELGSESLTEEFNDAIGKAKEVVRASLETILSWFNRSEVTFLTSYDLGTAVKIAADSAGVAVRIDSNSQWTLKGETLSNFVDIFYILFENAASKSGLPLGDIDLALSLEDKQGSMVIRVANATAEVPDVVQRNDKLESYRTPAGQDDFGGAIQREGGTGFFKIKKILARDLGTQFLMHIGFDSDRSFTVTLEIADAGRLTYDESAADRR
ncbi:MAG: hypothetical protein ABI640_20630 [Gammaproteobacteria bacterium]